MIDSRERDGWSRDRSEGGIERWAKPVVGFLEDDDKIYFALNVNVKCNGLSTSGKRKEKNRKKFLVRNRTWS